MNTSRFMEWEAIDVLLILMLFTLFCSLFLVVFLLLSFPKKRILMVKCFVKNQYIMQTTIKKCKELNK